MAYSIAMQDRAKPQQKPTAEAELVREYKKVGPAAIIAALLCKPKPGKQEQPRRSYEPREET